MTTLEINAFDIEYNKQFFCVDLIVEVTSYTNEPAKLFGLPENCYPAEYDLEYNINNIEMETNSGKIVNPSKLIDFIDESKLDELVDQAIQDKAEADYYDY